MKYDITAISDTHNKHKKLNLPGGDILIHAGDITSMGYFHEIAEFNKWFKNQNYTYKIFIAGNHDGLFETDQNLARSILDPSIIYLQDELAEIEGLKIWGSPRTPPFCNWHFMNTEEELDHYYYINIPPDIDILVTHGPPFGILDQTIEGQHVGSKSLVKHVCERIKPKYHLFGHIHFLGGLEKYFNGATFINASICDEQYMVTNPVKNFTLEI